MKKFLIFPLMLFTLQISANDTSGEILPAGNIQFKKQDGIKMSVEALKIRPGEVEVNYLFENTTDKDITTQVFFPLPETAIIEPYMRDYFYEHSFNFKLWVNGKQQAYDHKVSIYQYHEGEKRDITQFVWPFLKNKIKTGDSVITQADMHKALLALPKEEITSLEKQEIIKYDSYLTSDWEDSKDKEWQGKWRWRKEVVFYWEQTFPANKIVWIKHTYIPSEYGNVMGIPNNMCMDKYSEEYKGLVSDDKKQIEFEKFIASLREKQRVYGVDRYMKYILTTANNWQDGIGSFNLLVESWAGAAVCFNNELFLTDKTFFVKNLKNFSPQYDFGAEFVVKDNREKTFLSTYKLYQIDGPANMRAKPKNGKIIGQMENKTYVWAKEEPKAKGWYFVIQGDASGYTFENNLISVFN